MLKIDHVTKYYGTLKAVDDLSFAVKPGEKITIEGTLVIMKILCR